MIIEAIDRICSGTPISTFWPRASIVSPFSFACVRRVSTKPKATALTLIFSAPHSFASVFVSPTMPAFADE